MAPNGAALLYGAALLSHGAALRSQWCGVAQYGAALLNMVRRCSAWCGVAQYGAALLSMVRRCSVYGAALLS